MKRKPREMNPRAWIVTKQGMTGDLYEALAWNNDGKPLGVSITTPTPLYEGEALRAKLTKLDDLLAVIHRDGGHYQAEHGTAKAIEDAIAAVHALRAANGDLRDELEAFQASNDIRGAEVDRLRAENAALLAANRDCLTHFEDMRQEWGKMDAYDDVERAIHGRAGVIIDGKEWKLVPVEATQAMLDAAEKIDWSGEDVLGNCCNQWYAMLAAAPPAPVVEVTKATCAKVARANVDARLAAAPDEILESVTASGMLAWLFKWQQVLGPTLGMVTREELARAGGGVHGGPLGCRRRRKRVERDCSPRLAQEPRPQGDRGWGVSRTWVAVGVRGNWSVEDLAKPNGENIVADCGNDPWSESNARKIAKAQDEITALRARIAELERDAARLSWIEEKTNSAERPIEEGRPVDAVATIRNAQSDAREDATRSHRQYADTPSEGGWVMDISECIDILRRHNDWRRFGGDIKNAPLMVPPDKIGRAIDMAIRELEKVKANGDGGGNV